MLPGRVACAPMNKREEEKLADTRAGVPQVQ